MENIKYRIVFKGETVDNSDIEEVKSNLSILLKINIKAVEKLFSGKQIVVKKNSNISECKKIENIFIKAGAVCYIEKEEGISDSVKGDISNSIPDNNIKTSDDHNDRPEKSSLITSETKISNLNHNNSSKLHIFIKYLSISLFFISIWYFFSFIKALILTMCFSFIIYFSDTIQKIAEKMWYNRIYILSSLKDIIANIFLRFKEKASFLYPQNFSFINKKVIWFIVSLSLVTLTSYLIYSYKVSMVTKMETRQLMVNFGSVFENNKFDSFIDNPNDDFINHLNSLLKQYPNSDLKLQSLIRELKNLCQQWKSLYQRVVEFEKKQNSEFIMSTLTEGFTGGLEGLIGAGKGKRRAGGIGGFVSGTFFGALDAWGKRGNMPPDLDLN